MKTCKELHCNTRTIKQPEWHSSTLGWFTAKMDWQIKKAGIKFIRIPWTLK